MARIGYGQTKPKLFDHMQIMVCHLKIMTPFVDDRPGEKWYRLFLLQFPDLALWKAQLLSKLHAGVSWQAINDWFWELWEYLFKMGNIDILEQANRIHNCDKTGGSNWHQILLTLKSKIFTHKIAIFHLFYTSVWWSKIKHTVGDFDFVTHVVWQGVYFFQYCNLDWFWGIFSLKILLK